MNKLATIMAMYAAEGSSKIKEAGYIMGVIDQLKGRKEEKDDACDQSYHLFIYLLKCEVQIKLSCFIITKINIYLLHIILKFSYVKNVNSLNR